MNYEYVFVKYFYFILWFIDVFVNVCKVVFYEYCWVKCIFKKEVLKIRWDVSKIIILNFIMEICLIRITGKIFMKFKIRLLFK